MQKKKKSHKNKLFFVVVTQQYFIHRIPEYYTFLVQYLPDEILRYKILCNNQPYLLKLCDDTKNGGCSRQYLFSVFTVPLTLKSNNF